MPVISIDITDLLQLVQHDGAPDVLKERVLDAIPRIGATVEGMEGTTLEIELNPNRPDMYSVEGLARALRTFLGVQRNEIRYKTKKSDVVMHVDRSVRDVRPYIACALIRDIAMSDQLIKSLMDVQEKLHVTYGRKRKKVSIGIHDIRPLTPPFSYKAISPNGIRFVPLGRVEYMNLSEILEQHEKGIEYASTLDGFDQYPIITDSAGEVLSFPPIINGALTTVTEATTELFIEVTGTDKTAVIFAANILAALFAERGGTIETVEVTDGSATMTPKMEPIPQTLDVEYVNHILDTDLTPKEVSESLITMGYATRIRGKRIAVSIPCYRVDIIHPIDLVEDVAIGYGYDNFDVELPSRMTFGAPLPLEQHAATLRSIMIGLGFHEIMTLSLSSEERQFATMNCRECEHVKIENPITQDHTMLRTWLVPSTLDVLRANKHHELPQSLFEIGDCVEKTGAEYGNIRKMAAIKISAKTNFSDIKGIAEALLRDSNVRYTIAPATHPSFIEGRCAAIMQNDGKKDYEVGIFGELAPDVITRFDLDHPITAIEIVLDALRL